jgi:hypothetical protein
MNRMTRTIAHLSVLTCCFLLLAQGAATAAGSAPKKSAAKKAESPNSCAYLDFLFESSTTAQVRSSGVACDHGNLSSIETQENTKLVGLQQSASYGPDCTVTVTWAGGQKTAVIRGQQNFCALSAGNIIASVVSGPATITRIETGAYSKRPGRVYVRLNN